MFGFHRRQKSLIPVKDMEKMETTCVEKHVEVEIMEEPEIQTPRQRRNLIMILLLFLAEAIMASSLSSQIDILLPSATACLTMNTSFLRSILQCAYYFGSAAGIAWGFLTDRVGRRRIAVAGLCGMSTCCGLMMFANTFEALCVLRCVSGAISAAVTTSGLAMLADVTHGSRDRSKTVARLPFIAVCGQMGPVVAKTIKRLAQDYVPDHFEDAVGLYGEIACGLLVVSITIAEILLLDETLYTSIDEVEEVVDCEKAAFLGPQRASTDSDDSLAISIIEALHDDAAAARASKISISQMCAAPSVMLLIASFSILSLHSSTFEVILPHIGHTNSRDGGMSLPCSWLQPVMLIVKVVAALRVMHFVPMLINKVGILPMYRRISIVFPALYLIVPAVAFAVTTAGASPIVPAVVGTMATLAKTTLAGAAQVLVMLLIFSAAPDAGSTGTLIGVVSISELFKALAVGLTGIGYYLGDEYSMMIVNGSFWLALACIATIGALLTRGLREIPRIGTDLPAECFVWQGMFDAESDDEAGF